MVLFLNSFQMTSYQYGILGAHLTNFLLFHCVALREEPHVRGSPHHFARYSSTKLSLNLTLILFVGKSNGLIFPLLYDIVHFRQKILMVLFLDSS